MPGTRMPEPGMASSAPVRRLLVVAGDVRGRTLLEEQPSEQSRSLLHMVDVHTQAPGVDTTILDQTVRATRS